MNKSWRDIKIYEELEQRAAEIEDELEQDGVSSNPLLKGMTGVELILLEAMGYVIDLTTGLVKEEGQQI